MKKSLFLGLVFCMSLMFSFASFAQDEALAIDSCNELTSELCTANDPTCAWDEESNICLNNEEEMVGPLWDNNRCWNARGPRECNYSRGCRWDPRRGCVERGRPFPMPPINRYRCDRIRNPFSCNYTPGCQWNLFRFRCEDRRYRWPN